MYLSSMVSLPAMVIYICYLMLYYLKHGYFLSSGWEQTTADVSGPRLGVFGVPALLLGPPPAIDQTDVPDFDQRWGIWDRCLPPLPTGPQLQPGEDRQPPRVTLYSWSIRHLDEWVGEREAYSCQVNPLASRLGSSCLWRVILRRCHYEH